MKPRLRVFLSYSHEDRESAARVADMLRSKGLLPLWDEDIRPGSAFSGAIKGLIAHAHVFMPLITARSQKRPWVHQETGYAMALNIPVLPLAVGKLPGEMIAQLQAVKVDPELSNLDSQLDAVNLERLVTAPQPKSLSMVEVADWPEKRVELMAQYANRVAEFNHFCRVHQRGGLSSFSIPDADNEDPIWKERDGEYPRSDYYHYYCLREERRALERHALQAGCDLLIDPEVETSGITHGARLVRLTTLLEFLKSIPSDQVRVVCSPRARDANITAVGDWFLAESRFRRPGQGWRQTVFTWHAPTVLQAQREFVQFFERLLAQSGCPPDESLPAAIARIEEIVKRLRTGRTPSAAVGSARSRSATPPGARRKRRSR